MLRTRSRTMRKRQVSGCVVLRLDICETLWDMLWCSTQNGRVGLKDESFRIDHGMLGECP